MVKNSLKTLVIAFVATFISVPPSAAHAEMWLDGPSPELVFENMSAAESVDMNVDIDMSTTTPDLDHPVSAHIGIDTVTDGNRNAQFAYEFWSTDPSGDFEDTEGTFTIVNNALYFSQDGKTWYSLTDEISVSESDRDDASDQAEEMASAIETLVEEGVVSYRYESVDHINGKTTMRYGYTVDMDRLVDTMEGDREIENLSNELSETSDMAEFREYLTNHVTMSGQVWIDTSEMLPVMFTSNITIAGNASSVTTIDVSVLFNSFNESATIVAPTSYTTLTDNRLSETAAFAVDRIGDVFAVADIDGDGLSNDEEGTWHSNPFRTDTDDDGYLDETEVVNGYNPNGTGKLDSDGDGLTNYAEMTIHWSDPYDADTDNDGYNDGLEIANGYSPLGPGRF